MEVFNAGKINQELHSKYDKNNAPATKSQIIDKLYGQYKKQLSQPKLTASNLAAAVRYIKKHNVRQKDYGKMLKSAKLSGTSVLTRKDFADIYERITKDNGTGVSYQEAKQVIDDYLGFIHDNVKKGNKVRVGRLGYFCLQHSNGRHYHNKYGHGVTDPHNYASFHVSTEFKRDVK